MEVRVEPDPELEHRSGGLARVLAVADDPADGDDVRRRKRVGVVAGYATIVAPLTLPIMAAGSPVSIALAVGLSAFAAVNLIVLVRSRDFERYVVALILAGTVFVPTATFLVGGITGPASGLVWGFLIPAYAILALGPRASVRWFVVYLGLVALMVVVDPIAHAMAPVTPYPIELFGAVVNTVVPLSIVYVLLRYTDVRRIAAEARVEELLTNAIPPSIANRLRRGERRIADAYPETSVVFADIVGFTPFAQRTAPGDVVDLLDGLFTTFDALAERRGLEKIKTIGDAYMAVAGAPTPIVDHADAAIAFGRDVIDAVAETRASSRIPLEVRVGIASGPTVGGVIGRQRLQFDLWGDTVNLASRMESSGVPGRIQISASTASRIGDHAPLERREVDVKGLGTLTTFLIA